MLTILESMKRFFKSSPEIHTLEDFIEHIRKTKRVIVLTSRHCGFIGSLFVEAFNKLGIQVTVIFKRPMLGYSKLPHIVICPQVFKQLPPNYIAMQMEQSESSQWFTKEYFTKLNQAIAICDYSLLNIDYLKKHIEDINKIFHLPISINRSFLDKFNNDFGSRKYDIIFYGADNCLRRQTILNTLKSKYRLKIIRKGMFGDALYKELADAKIVINIHYYENALLETTRLYECLSLNNNVIISEVGRDQDKHTELEEVIDFIEIDDIVGLMNRIDYYLSDNNRLNQKINKNKEILNNIKTTEFETTILEKFKV